MLCKQVACLIDALAALPGLNQRSAIRAVSHMFSNWDGAMLPIGQYLKNAINEVKRCDICWNFSDSDPCNICLGSNKRNREIICVVEDVGALWAIEKKRVFNGMYHVLGGLLSASNGVTPRELNLDNLLKRIQSREGPLEIIMAVSSSIDSSITIEYVFSAIRHIDAEVKISRVSQGIPNGVRIDGVDEATISAALLSRTLVE